MLRQGNKIVLTLLRTEVTSEIMFKISRRITIYRTITIRIAKFGNEFLSETTEISS